MVAIAVEPLHEQEEEDEDEFPWPGDPEPPTSPVSDLRQ